MSDPARLYVEMPNLTCVELGKTLTVWFSYSTPIAFAAPGLGRIKSENVWSRTTGKHLNSIYAKETVPHDEFTARLSDLMARVDAAVVPQDKSEVNDLLDQIQTYFDADAFYEEDMAETMARLRRAVAAL